MRKKKSRFAYCELLTSSQDANYSRDMNWDTIIDAAGGTSAVADALEQSLSTVSGWRSRGIPGPYWVSIVRLIVRCGRRDITLDMLAKLAARKLESGSTETRT